MRFDAADDVLRQEAAAWLRSQPDAAIIDLAAVLRSSPGYYPAILAQEWRAEVSRRGLENDSVAGGDDRTRRLPVCHPGDYEWRFTDQTAADLADDTSAGLRPGAVVAHVGAPTTFIVGRTRHPQLQHALLERSELIIQSLGGTGHMYQMDLTKDKPAFLGAQAAIIDPPWYTADTKAFLWATNFACAVGARIVLCQPTLATRPGIAEERATLVNELPQLGYACRRIDVGRARYRTPHFEVTSLRAAAPDLPVPGDWRVGDVLALEKAGDPLRELPPSLPTEAWHEVLFGPVRIKLRRTEPPDLGQIVTGNVLDTVSRRDPIRDQIGLWTSGNRVFSLNHPKVFAKIIDLCHSDVMQSRFTLDRTLSSAKASGLDDHSAQRLFDLLLVELQEHALRRDP